MENKKYIDVTNLTGLIEERSYGVHEWFPPSGLTASFYITCSCQCNHSRETEIIRFNHINLDDYRISELQGDPLDFRMVIEPTTQNPYFVSSSFTGKCEEIDWKELEIRK